MKSVGRMNMPVVTHLKEKNEGCFEVRISSTDFLETLREMPKIALEIVLSGIMRCAYRNESFNLSYFTLAENSALEIAACCLVKYNKGKGNMRDLKEWFYLRALINLCENEKSNYLISHIKWQFQNVIDCEAYMNFYYFNLTIRMNFVFHHNCEDDPELTKEIFKELTTDYKEAWFSSHFNRDYHKTFKKVN